ncbi:MAG: ABC transporter substrate-binding protein, partial [Chloroflexi bacterium]|nr:ABC transporter substrate-binding protein [Chloroflexota bacterium]
IAPFTGASFLRDPYLDNVLNLRASYYQETDEMVARLTEDLGITRVAVLYQDDSYGRDGLEGVLLALQRRDMQPVVSWHYPR